MENLVPIAVWIVVLLVGLGLLSILLFGIRSVMSGKINKTSMIFMAVPLLLFAGIGLGTGDWPQAGIITTLVLIACAVLAMFWTSLQGLFQ